MLEYGAILGILIVVGYWIIHPLFWPKPQESLSLQRRTDKGDALLQKKEAVYSAIKEMDLDFGMGKISKEDYRELRSQYTEKALEILKELDTVDREDDINVAIEREVQRLRGKTESERDGGSGEETSCHINFCPQCGRKVPRNDCFCQGCGMRLIFPGGRD